MKGLESCKTNRRQSSVLKRGSEASEWRLWLCMKTHKDSRLGLSSHSNNQSGACSPTYFGAVAASSSGSAAPTSDCPHSWGSQYRDNNEALWDPSIITRKLYHIIQSKASLRQPSTRHICEVSAPMQGNGMDTFSKQCSVTNNAPRVASLPLRSKQLSSTRPWRSEQSHSGGGA